jgi:hypothetical protein
MKRRHQADHLRTLVDEDDNIIGLWKKMMTLDAVYGAPQARSSVDPVMLVLSRRKLLPDLEEDDLQGFPNDRISKSNILDMVCAKRSFENINEEMLNNGYRVMSVNWASST